MKRFCKLLRKDLEASRLPVLFLSGATLALMAYVRLRLANSPVFVETAESYWPSGYLVLALILPITFFPLWLVWRSLQTLRSEWREDTIYTLMALPVPGWQVMLSKLIGLCVEYTTLFVVTMGGFLLFLGRVLELDRVLPGPAWVAVNAFWVYVGGLLLFAALAVQVQLAFVVGKMVGRAHGLVALWAWILAVWFSTRVSGLLQPLFSWLPPVPLHELLRLDELGEGVLLLVYPEKYVVFGLVTVLFFILTGLLFERHMEISS